MELRQLKYFIAVAEELNFTRAAERCHIAQPPLSQQIKKLEEELGVVLLDRTNRKVSVTPEGKSFLTVARNTLETLEHGVEQIRLMAEGIIGTLRIGFLNSATHTRFPDAITAFRTKHPGILLDIHDLQSVDQNKALRAGGLDVVLCHHCYADHNSMESKVFLRDSYLMAVHQDHPLAAKQLIDWADLDDEPFIMFSREHYPKAYERALRRFHKYGVRPRIIQEAKTHQTKLSLIAAGMGLGFVPERMRAVRPNCVRLIPFNWRNEKQHSALKLAWLKGEISPALRCFLDVMNEFCEDDGEPLRECWSFDGDCAPDKQGL